MNFKVPSGRELFYHDDRSYAPKKLKFNAMTHVNDCLKGEWLRVAAEWQNCYYLLPALPFLGFLDCVFRYEEKSTDAAIRARPHQKSISSQLGSCCLLGLNLWNLEQETSPSICTLDRSLNAGRWVKVGHF
jgi:hypothetical protein